MSRWAWAAVLCATSLVVGCVRTPTAPIRQVRFEQHGPQEAPRLVILLPGIRDDPEVFAAEHFVERLQSIPHTDVAAVDAHLGYYRDGDNNLLHRLRDDVVTPARERGYQDVWLVGVSLGGFGALAFAQHHPTLVRGVIAIAPYPGPEDLVDDIAQRSLCGWRSGNPAELDEHERFSQGIWGWLREHNCEGRTAPKLFLGVGSSDDFAPAIELMASSLPSQQVYVADGGHDWATWRTLLDELAPRAFAQPETAPSRSH